MRARDFAICLDWGIFHSWAECIYADNLTPVMGDQEAGCSLYRQTERIVEPNGRESKYKYRAKGRTGGLAWCSIFTALLIHLSTHKHALSLYTQSCVEHFKREIWNVAHAGLIVRRTGTSTTMYCTVEPTWKKLRESTRTSPQKVWIILKILRQEIQFVQLLKGTPCTY